MGIETNGTFKALDSTRRPGRRAVRGLVALGFFALTLAACGGAGSGGGGGNNINPGVGSSPTGFTVFNGALYFAASDGDLGLELWKSDGTNTVMVKDINTGPNGSSPSGFTVFNGALYFAASDGNLGLELWKTDGTVGGTVLVKDINPGANGSFPLGLT